MLPSASADIITFSRRKRGGGGAAHPANYSSAVRSLEAQMSAQRPLFENLHRHLLCGDGVSVMTDQRSPKFDGGCLGPNSSWSIPPVSGSNVGRVFNNHDIGLSPLAPITLQMQFNLLPISWPSGDCFWHNVHFRVIRFDYRNEIFEIEISVTYSLIVAIFVDFWWFTDFISNLRRIRLNLFLFSEMATLHCHQIVKLKQWNVNLSRLTVIVFLFHFSRA